LVQQIDELEPKRVITPGLKELGHTVRMIGNWGAHPQQDPLRTVSNDDAAQILEFTFQFLEELYVRPARLMEIKKQKGIK
jgi:hypothetical protein